jgi:hypothetical protein
MVTLAGLYGHDGGTLQHLLDELLRRGLLGVAAAADWLTTHHDLDTQAT